MRPLPPKASHVVRQGQTREHVCHWPGCAEQVPPAKWGCRRHWYALPETLRQRIWRTYRIGQESDGRPSPEYIAAARAVKDWIEAHAAGAMTAAQKE